MTFPQGVLSVIIEAGTVRSFEVYSAKYRVASLLTRMGASFLIGGDTDKHFG